MPENIAAMAYTPTSIKNVTSTDSTFDITTLCDQCGHLSIHPGTVVTALKLTTKTDGVVDMTTLLGQYDGMEWLSKKVVHPITGKLITGFFSEIAVSSGNVVLFV